LNQKPGAKIEWKLTWHCCICCNPAKGRVDFEDGWLLKIKKKKTCTKGSQFRGFYYSIGLVQSTLFSIFADAKHTDLNYGTIVENH
jgi:hypothetical protein